MSKKKTVSCLEYTSLHCHQQVSTKFFFYFSFSFSLDSFKTIKNTKFTLCDIKTPVVMSWQLKEKNFGVKKLCTWNVFNGTLCSSVECVLNAIFQLILTAGRNYCINYSPVQCRTKWETNSDMTAPDVFHYFVMYTLIYSQLNSQITLCTEIVKSVLSFIFYFLVALK
jgi:hypothetical protein